MNIIIAGDGKVGRTLTSQLSSEGHNITLIDSNPSVLEKSMDQFDVMTVCGNCASMTILESAAVKDADLLIAATSMDEINMLCCMTAHAMNDKLHTIARIRNPEYAKQLSKMKDLFALSLVVNPEKHTASEIEQILKLPGFLKRDKFARGRMQIVELKVQEGTNLCDVSLNDLKNVINAYFLVFSVMRNGEFITPGGDFVLRKNDHIYVAAATDELDSFLRGAKIYKHKVKKVTICGGGRIAYYLAKTLHASNINVKIIETNPDTCELLAELLPPQVSIINGDASSQSLLIEEGIETTDALITLTGLDEMNVIISLFGKNCGVEKIVTKLGHMDHTRIIDELDIGSTVYPKYVCSAQILRYVRALKNQSGAALSVHPIADGNIEALEFAVDEKTLHKGVALKDLKIKKNTLVVCINRNRHAFIPNGDSCLLEGDTVVIISSGNDVIYTLNDIFQK